MSNWQQPICGKCWRFRKGRTPPPTDRDSHEICCYCGRLTTEGLTIHADPTRVPYPRGKSSSLAISRRPRRAGTASEPAIQITTSWSIGTTEGDG